MNSRSKSFKYCIYFFAYALLVLNIGYNVFGIVHRRILVNYDEAMVIGRILKTEQDGLFSAAGFTGVIYDKNSVPEEIRSLPDYYYNYQIRDTIFNNNIKNQFDYFFGEKSEIPTDYYPYMSESAGNVMIYSATNKLLGDMNPYNKIRVFRLINSTLVAIMLLLFVSWCIRNYGTVAGVIVYLFMFFTPWLVKLGGQIHWCLWTYYLPFMAMLLLLEKRHRNGGQTKEWHILLGLFIAVFMKHLLFGFEFVTTILVAAFPPIVYYYWLEKRSFRSFLIFTVKAGIVALLAVFCETLIYFKQLAIYNNTDMAGSLRYFMFLFEKRSGVNEVNYLDSFCKTMSYYFTRGNFNKYLDLPSIVNYWTFILFAALMAVYLYSKKIKGQLVSNSRKYSALILTTLFSFLCPLSWFIIFLEHAYDHLHIDFIVFYVPFMLFVYLIIGIGISELSLQLKSRFYKKSI